MRSSPGGSALHLSRPRIAAALCGVLGVFAAAFAPAAAAEPKPAAAAPGVLLVTLDTTRSDFLGCYGGQAATPNLDGLAVRGTRWARALTASPLTLPAHASLLTGLVPPEHGLLDNGSAALGAGVPTLATELAARGYATAAFVGSRVLDRRFGLDRGFAVYDDRMAAEELGEYGYPERDAEAVTDAALAWLSELAAGEPWFLWVHYYDPHSPYRPPARWSAADDRGRYAGEIAFVDHQLGRLLAALPGPPEGHLVAAVGDHGEMLGEHGERAHGIFLYRAALEVPLIIAGAGVPAGRVVEETVASRRLAATLLRLLTPAGDAAAAAPPGPVLPGPVLPGSGALGDDPPPEAVFSDTHLPSTAYGWSPLTALSDQRHRLIVAPRPELYDYLADPAEATDLLSEERTAARRLKRELERRQAAYERRPATAAGDDPELAAALRSLGYATGSRGAGDGIDPKDGIALLDELEAGKRLLDGGRAAEAAVRLAALAERNPSNVPLLGHLARAQLAAGRGDEAIATYRRAVGLNPELDFLHLNLAHGLRRLGRLDEARREYELALEINPRAAAAWLSLAELARDRGAAAEERSLLERAVAAGTASAGVLARLGQIEMESGAGSAADHLRQATELAPQWQLAWLLRAQAHLRAGEPQTARPLLERAIAVAPGTHDAGQARHWLQQIGPPAPPSPDG